MIWQRMKEYGRFFHSSFSAYVRRCLFASSYILAMLLVGLIKKEVFNLLLTHLEGRQAGHPDVL